MVDVNFFDLALVVDLTGSMSSLLANAKRDMISMISKLSKHANIKMRVGIVGYRDHKPQDNVLTIIHDFSDNLELVQRTINSLSAAGGGDNPEAVLDGVNEAVQLLTWNKHSRRVAVLIGDAPPHGVGAGGDHFPKGCPCGETVRSITAAVEKNRTILYAIGLTSDAVMQKSFTELAVITGGQFFNADANKAITTIEEILKREFSNIEFDKTVLDLWTKKMPSEDIAKALGSNSINVGASLSRLGSRELLGTHETLS